MSHFFNKKNKRNLIQYGIPLLFWAAIIIFFIVNRDRITIADILTYTPGQPALAALVMLALFALKSLTFVVYVGLLYIVNGIMFPLPWAFVINILGTAIMAICPYFLGRLAGNDLDEKVREKLARTGMLSMTRDKNSASFCFLLRMIKILPYDLVSIYMGCTHRKFWPYLIVSVVGMLPEIVTFPIIGTSILDIRSPQFIISLAVEVVVTIISVIIFLFIRHKAKKQHIAGSGMPDANTEQVK